MRCGVISKVLVKTGSTLQAWGMMYKVVAQSFLLYGSDSWVVTGKILKLLEEFHHREAREITGMTATCGVDGEWGPPPVVAEMEAVGLQPIQEYIRKRQETMSKKWPAAPFRKSATRRSRCQRKYGWQYGGIRM